MLIGVIILAVVFYLTTPVEQKEYTYSEIETLFREEKVKSFSLEGDELTLNLYSADSDGNTTIKKTLPSPNWFREDLGDLIDAQTASGVLTEYDYVKGWTAPWWMSILPYLITVVLFIGGNLRFCKAHSTSSASCSSPMRTVVPSPGVETMVIE